jgi:ABC-type amino acid transport substrate-binding protein
MRYTFNFRDIAAQWEFIAQGIGVTLVLTVVKWLNSFIFFTTMNGELDKLHRKWLGVPMAPLPTL